MTNLAPEKLMPSGELSTNAENDDEFTARSDETGKSQLPPGACTAGPVIEAPRCPATMNPEVPSVEGTVVKDRPSLALVRILLPRMNPSVTRFK
jgi:hypothetical protein